VGRQVSPVSRPKAAAVNQPASETTSHDTMSVFDFQLRLKEETMEHTLTDETIETIQSVARKLTRFERRQFQCERPRPPGRSPGRPLNTENFL
jgi:hypothetical protein